MVTIEVSSSLRVTMKGIVRMVKYEKDNENLVIQIKSTRRDLLSTSQVSINSRDVCFINCCCEWATCRVYIYNLMIEVAEFLNTFSWSFGTMPDLEHVTNALSLSPVLLTDSFVFAFSLVFFHLSCLSSQVGWLFCIVNRPNSSGLYNSSFLPARGRHRVLLLVCRRGERG